MGSGQVAVPIERIAQRWLGYYWPIVGSGRFIPQSRAEGAGSARHLSLRAPLVALVAEFAGQGEHSGLGAWHAAANAGQLTADVQLLHREALRAIAYAIRAGPVTYAGGALETGPVFDYDRTTRSVVTSAALWRELSLLGHWIIDAVIVRWAGGGRGWTRSPAGGSS